MRAGAPASGLCGHTEVPPRVQQPRPGPHLLPLLTLDLLEVLSDIDEMSRRRPEILGFFSVRELRAGQPSVRSGPPRGWGQPRCEPGPAPGAPRERGAQPPSGNRRPDGRCLPPRVTRPWGWGLGEQGPLPTLTAVAVLRPMAESLGTGGLSSRHAPAPADQSTAADELCRGAVSPPGLRPGPALHPEQPQVSPGPALTLLAEGAPDQTLGGQLTPPGPGRGLQGGLGRRGEASV